jgi:hypothetical protein
MSDSDNSDSEVEEGSHGEDIDEQNGAAPKAMTKVGKNGTSNCCGGWSILYLISHRSPEDCP